MTAIEFYTQAFYGSSCGQSDERRPAHVEISAIVPTVEAAREIAATFTKSIGVKATSLHRADGHYGYLFMRVKLWADGSNGGRNETGIARYQRFRKACDKLGYAVHYGTRPNNQFRYGNMYETEVEAHEAMGIAPPRCGFENSNGRCASPAYAGSPTGSCELHELPTD